MPLIRFNVRNEYGLGDPGLYRGANKDDPKALLEAVAVSGLVGILRQLGDLAEFAAVVFNDLHEQVTATAARGHEMLIRMQRIEAELPPLEKAVMAQTSHIHFAYTEGSDWHPNIQTEQNHLAHNVAPRFIKEPYDECRHPPRLLLLDKFDTDGDGACLKRYSDPSFFKMACIRSELMNPENLQRENNAHKCKKKGRQQSSVEIHSLSKFQHHRRKQFASSDTEGQSSAETPEIIFTCDALSKSERAGQPTSFDSASNMNCTEHVLDITSTIGPDKTVDKELLTSKMKMQSNNICASVVNGIWDGESAENDSPSVSLQGQSIPRSPSVTWDQKTEISKYSSKKHEDITEDRDQVIEPVPVSCSQYELEQESVTLIDVDKTPESFPGEKHFDEIAGETDSYMDALNTMESEYGTDSECQTKWEVELNFNLMDQGIASVTSGKQNTLESSDCYNGYPVPPYSAPRKEISLEVSDSDTTKSSFHAQPGHIKAMTSSVDSVFSKSSDHHDMSSAIGFESVNSNLSSVSRISNPQGNKLTAGLCTPEGSSENSKVSSTISWRNGRLFGLDPSKPLDVKASDFVSEKASSDITVNVGDGSVGKAPSERIPKNSHSVKERDGSSHIVGPANLHLHPDRLVGRTGNIVQPIHHTEDSVPGHDKRDNNILMKQNSQNFVRVVSETLTEKFEDSHPEALAESESFAIPGAESSVGSNIEVSSCLPGTDCSYYFQSNESLIPDTATKLSTIANSDNMKLQERPHCLEQKRRLTKIVSKISHAPTPKEQLELEPPEYRFPSKSGCAYHPSPPLEHMKISFHPINCFEASKMKLKSPDGHQCQEGIQDIMFPAFQLRPEHAIPLQDVASESDDDTFCRSSPYPSEDLCSLRSEPNSEQWESGELTGSKHCRSHNALHRASSITSISSSFELEETHSKIRPSHEFGSLDAQDDAKSFDPDISKDIQNYSAIDQSMSQQEGKFGFGQSDFQSPALQRPNDLPPPPPLPPLQWRIAKPTHTLIEDTRHTTAKAENQPNDRHACASTAPLPPKPPVPEQPNTEGACPRKSKQDKKEQIGCRQLNQTGNAKAQDEMEDFLHQIKTKSFNLRRTVTGRPSFMPAPATNINVVAILEKANAIRQAFASSDDDNDDESWSDD